MTVLNYGTIEHYRGDIVNLGDDIVIGKGTTFVTHCPISFYTGEDVSIVIGSNVFIGMNCLVLPGVKVGSDVVIGAGSVVAKDVPSGVIAAGNPCVPIREMTGIEKRRLRLMTRQEKVGDGTEPDWGKE